MPEKNRGDLPEDMHSFVKSLKKAAGAIKMHGPDYIFAPVVGAVPLVDLLCIVDRKFPKDLVEYLPNSSRFRNRTNLMKNWYSNFYKEKNFSEKTKIVCLDEVLSGSSSVGGFIQFQNSLEKLAREKSTGFDNESEMYEHFLKKLKSNIDYKIVGFAENGYEINLGYKKLLNKNIAHSVFFDELPTVDNPLMNIMQFKEDKRENDERNFYFPEIKKFEITSEYLTLLKSVASYVGADPSRVGPVNLTKIQEGLSKSLNKE